MLRHLNILNARISTPAIATLLVAATVLSMGSTAEAGRRVITFTNKTGQACDDLHIETAQGTTIDFGTETTPFRQEKGTNDSNKHNLYGATIANNGSATVAMTCDEATFIINRWWWTSGGTAFVDGAKVGEIHDSDTGGSALSFSGGPARGDGSVLCSIDGLSLIFNTVPGAPPEVSAQMYQQFLESFVDRNRFDLIATIQQSPTQVLALGNVQGDPLRELQVQIIRPDSIQQMQLIPSRPAPDLYTTGGCPGRVTATVEDATPFGQVAFYYSVRDGSANLGGCPGVTLDLRNPVFVGNVPADPQGTAHISGNVPAAGCGHVKLQAADLQSCQTTNVVGL